jgi:hypothetical protein
MRSSRLVVASTITALTCLAAQSASAAVRVDQRCGQKTSRSGYGGATLSQSFKPTGATVSRVNVQLAATREQGLTSLRVRIVGRRVLPETEIGKTTAQLVVLAERDVTFAMPGQSSMWLPMTLPKPIAWADAGPGVDEYAVEVAFPQDNYSLMWLTCQGYAKGEASVDEDPATAAGSTSDLAVTQSLPADLAFVLYTSR